MITRLDKYVPFERVDYQTIWKIRKGISWKHVSEETVSGN
jgi:hypothetical protein